jgi:hypothetical protein
MTPSVTTKECLLGAILLISFAGNEVIYFSLLGLFLSIKLAGVFGVPADPFKPIEQVAFDVLEGMAGSVEKEKTN